MPAGDALACTQVVGIQIREALDEQLWQRQRVGLLRHAWECVLRCRGRHSVAGEAALRPSRALVFSRLQLFFLLVGSLGCSP